MALLFDLKINDIVIGHFEAVRIAGGDRPDSINTYRIRISSDVGDTAFEIMHRYGDGALRLVHKALSYIFDDEDEAEAYAMNELIDELGAEEIHR